MDDKIFIPKKIKVGFNIRTDTFTGKLGYVIYHDGKTWRKEKSWENWRESYISPEEFQAKKEAEYNKQLQKQTEYFNSHKCEEPLEEYLKLCNLDKIEDFHFTLRNFCQDASVNPVEYENIPLEGFVLNKNVGGYKSGWDVRATYCRVYDPRGFEFEISIPNLLYILQNASCTVGKGLEGKFIYGWQGTELILIPEGAPEYEEMIKFTTLQSGKVLKKSLVPGGKYITKDKKEVVFIEENYVYDYYGVRSVEKVLWFVDGKNSVHLAMENIKADMNTIVDNYADLYSILVKNYHHTPEKLATFIPLTSSQIDDHFRNRYFSYGYSCYMEKKGTYVQCYITRRNSNYTLSKIRNSYKGEQFTSLQKLLETHTLYCLKKT